MTTNDLTALLAADLSDRENRLVLADALEERGRAEEAALARDLEEPVYHDRGKIHSGYWIDEPGYGNFQLFGLPGDGWDTLATVTREDDDRATQVADYRICRDAWPLTARQLALAEEAIRDHVEDWADNAHISETRLWLQWTDARPSELVRGEEE